MSLFTSDAMVARFTAERVPAIARYLGITPSADYIKDKLLAAEADAQRELHVFFEPTALFPDDPTQAEIDALAGKPWAVDPGYDYDGHMTQPGGWSFVALRQRPVISLESVKFSYPTMGTIFEVQKQWIKLDKKYGHLRYIPTGHGFTHQMGSPMIGAAGLQTAPQFVEVRYTAGLKNAAADFPDLMDLVPRMAILRMMGETVLPASGSISADGLSQSTSAPDLDKMQGGIDRLLGTLRDRIHGVPLVVC